jgi:hypothetical protein
MRDFFSGEKIDCAENPDGTVSFSFSLESFRGKAFVIDLEQ